jgi:chaperonin GroES
MKSSSPGLQTCPIRTIGNRVIVLPDEPLEVSSGGILLPEISKEKPVCGTIVSVGPGLRRPVPPYDHIPMNSEIGDKVYYSQMAAMHGTIKFEDEEYIVLKEEDVLAYVNQ